MDALHWTLAVIAIMLALRLMHVDSILFIAKRIIRELLFKARMFDEITDAAGREIWTSLHIFDHPDGCHGWIKE